MKKGWYSYYFCYLQMRVPNSEHSAESFIFYFILGWIMTNVNT